MNLSITEFIMSYVNELSTSIHEMINNLLCCLI